MLALLGDSRPKLPTNRRVATVADAKKQESLRSDNEKAAGPSRLISIAAQLTDSRQLAKAVPANARVKTVAAVSSTTASSSPSSTSAAATQVERPEAAPAQTKSSGVTLARMVEETIRQNEETEKYASEASLIQFLIEQPERFRGREMLLRDVAQKGTRIGNDNALVRPECLDQVSRQAKQILDARQAEAAKHTASADTETSAGATTSSSWYGDSSWDSSDRSSLGGWDNDQSWRSGYGGNDGKHATSDSWWSCDNSWSSWRTEDNTTNQDTSSAAAPTSPAKEVAWDSVSKAADLPSCEASLSTEDEEKVQRCLAFIRQAPDKEKAKTLIRDHSNKVGVSPGLAAEALRRMDMEESQ